MRDLVAMEQRAGNTHDPIPVECLSKSVIARHERDLDAAHAAIRDHTDKLAELMARTAHSTERLSAVEESARLNHRLSTELNARIQGIEQRQTDTLAAVHALDATSQEHHRLMIDHINVSLQTREADIQSRLIRYENVVKLFLKLLAALTFVGTTAWAIYETMLAS